MKISYNWLKSYIPDVPEVEKLSDIFTFHICEVESLEKLLDGDVVFDIKKSVSLEGDSGPYLQYTHARINSVLAKATTAGLTASAGLAPEEVYPVERLVYQFEEVVAEALVDRAPHKVTGYLTELAAAFNTFYAHEKIADKEDTYAPYKIVVAEAVKQTLKNGLWVLGIKAPERM